MTNAGMKRAANLRRQALQAEQGSIAALHMLGVIYFRRATSTRRSD